MVLGDRCSEGDARKDHRPNTDERRFRHDKPRARSGLMMADASFVVEFNRSSAFLVLS